MGACGIVGLGCIFVIAKALAQHFECWGATGLYLRGWRVGDGAFQHLGINADRCSRAWA